MYVRHTQNGQMDKLGSCSIKDHTPLVKPGPLGVTLGTRASTEQTPEAWPGTRRSTDYGISINGVGTRSPVPPRPPLVMIAIISGFVHPSFIQARYPFYSWVRWGWCDGRNTCTGGDRSHNHYIAHCRLVSQPLDYVLVSAPPKHTHSHKSTPTCMIS